MICGQEIVNGDDKTVLCALVSAKKSGYSAQDCVSKYITCFLNEFIMYIISISLSEFSFEMISFFGRKQYFIK